MSADVPPIDEPGFDLYANQQGRIIASSIAFIILTTGFVSLRLLSRRLSGARFWWDDLLAVIALVFCIVTCSLNFIRTKLFASLEKHHSRLIVSAEINHGFGRHIYIYGEPDAMVKARLWLRTLYVFETMYHTSTTFAKYSILAFYYRVFAIPQFRRILYMITAFVTCYVISVDLVCLFQCTPVHSFWDLDVPRHCVNIDRFFIASGAVNVFLDFIIFAVPIPLLWRLRTSFNQKLVLTAIFTVAGFVVIVSIVRIIVLSRIGKKDITWNYINGALWAVAEPSVAVICACLPSLRPLFATTYNAMSRIPKRVSISHSSRSGRWIKGKLGKDNDNGEQFSRLDEWEEQNKPMGHDVSVHGGEEVEMGEVPREGIQVKTEVVLVSSERLDYEDRLF
ncbi:MAG: hypothetical protein Q9210_007041 [Variospora velana]